MDEPISFNSIEGDQEECSTSSREVQIRMVNFQMTALVPAGVGKVAVELALRAVRHRHLEPCNFSVDVVEG